MKKYIYIHIAFINHWLTVFSLLIEKIKTSGLYDVVDEIRLGILGICNLSIEDPKFKIRGSSPDLSLHETFTLNLLHMDSSIEDFEVLYIHTKGVRKPNNSNVVSWTNYLIYFNIEKWSACCNLLQEYDCVGVNLLAEPKPHYSGNFWWSKSSYIRQLQPCKQDTYYSPEYWIGTVSAGKKAALWNSKCRHYLIPYAEELYKDKPVEIYSL
jgi:hypothetical protein